MYTLAARVLLLLWFQFLTLLFWCREGKKARPNFVWTEVKSFAVEFLCDGQNRLANSTANVMLKNKRIVLTWEQKRSAARRRSSGRQSLVWQTVLLKQKETIQVERHKGTFGRRLILAGWTALCELCEQIELWIWLHWGSNFNSPDSGVWTHLLQ